MKIANGQVTYRWRQSNTQQMATRTLSGAEFLRLLLQHVLPKGFRRARNFGFLHPNSKRLIALLRLLVFKQTVPLAGSTEPITRPQWLCPCCGAPMLIVRRRISPTSLLAPLSLRAARAKRAPAGAGSLPLASLAVPAPHPSASQTLGCAALPALAQKSASATSAMSPQREMGSKRRCYGAAGAQSIGLWVHPSGFQKGDVFWGAPPV